MTWDGKERRGDTITIAEVENAVYKANEKFFEKVEKMCNTNLENNLLKHTQEYPHFDKPTKTIIYDMIANFKRRIKIQYIIGVPLALLCVERFLNRIGWF